MIQKHASLNDMWNEWYGLGIYEDRCGDIPGGIAGRNALYKNKWRKYLNVSEGHYSRTCRIVKYLNSRVAEFGEEEALSSLNDLWWDLRCCLTPMLRALHTQGYIKKQKKRKAADSLENDK